MSDFEKDNVANISQNMGERLVMFQLYHYLGWDVEYVDYVGADLIAIDRKNKKKYAVSVKTRKMSEKWEGNKVTPESRSVTTFRDMDAKFLRCFANDMGMEPLVAYVIIFQRKEKQRGRNSAFLFLIGLDDLEDMRRDDKIEYVLQHVEKKKGKKNNEIEEDRGFSLRFGGKEESILNQLCDDSRVTWFKMEIDDYRIADKHNLNHKRTKNHLTTEHWKKQQGTFGEYLALWYLGKNHNMRGFRVDSTGTDIILLDADNPNNDNEQYAVSVKTFTYDKSCSYQFEKEHEEKLIEYSKKWTLDDSKSTIINPIICFNCVCYNEENQISNIYMMAFKVSHVDEISDKKYIYRTNGGITIRYDDDSLNEIKNDSEIIFSEINFKNYNYYLHESS